MKQKITFQNLCCLLIAVSMGVFSNVSLSQGSDKLPRKAAKAPKAKLSDVTSRIRVEEIVEPSADYRFSTFGRMDPFTPPDFDSDDLGTVATQQQQIISPLQRDLKDLTVKGVWELQGGQWRALIEVKDGPSVIADVGDPIGPSGKIVNIKQSGIETRQYRIRNDGVREYQDKMLAFDSSLSNESFVSSNKKSKSNVKKTVTPTQSGNAVTDFVKKVQKGMMSAD